MQIVVEVMGSLLQSALLKHSVYIRYVVRATLSYVLQTVLNSGVACDVLLTHRLRVFSINT
jgi:hypothetical protein